MKIEPETIEMFLSDIQGKTICDISYLPLRNNVEMYYNFEMKKLFIDSSLEFDDKYYQKLFFYSRIDYFNKQNLSPESVKLFLQIQGDKKIDMRNPYFIKALAFSNFFMQAIFKKTTVSNDSLYDNMIKLEENEVKKLFMKYNETKGIIC